MFTGIIRELGVMESLEHTPEGGRMTVRALGIGKQLKIADSVAVNGCCLTVVAHEGDTFAMDLSGETLRRTSFGEMKPGTQVNLEPPMRAGDDFGGHFVQGHVDGVGRVISLRPERNNGGAASSAPTGVPESWWLTVRVPEELGKYAAMKGSIALDGISLTIAGWHDGAVDIAIIPYTYEVTNVRNMRLGDPVNVEVDCLAKYIERLLEARETAAPSRLTVEKLVEQGF